MPTNLSAGDLQSFAAFAAELAAASGEVIRRHFRRPAAVETKADASPVTAADRETERVLRALIAARYPDHGIVGEEFAPERADAPLVWALDPIDGTKSFITGKPLFGTLIALLWQGRPVLGVIDHPIMGERWVGVAGEPTRLNGEAVQVRPCAELARASLYASHPDMFQGEDAPCFARLADAVALPLFGGDCYAYGLLASGFVDLIVEATLGPDDYFALVPVVEGAGGIVTDWAGRALHMGSDGRVIAAGDRRIHAAALALLAGETTSGQDPRRRMGQ